MERLIVDGYNVMHAWPELKRAMQTRGLEDARHALIRALSEYGTGAGVDVTVVFDSHGREGGRRDTPEMVDGVTVMYGTRAASADHVVERLANEAARAGRAEGVVVVTGDRLQRAMVGAMGVVTMSATGLREEVQRIAGDAARHTRRADADSLRAQRVEDRLQPEVLRRLERLRRNLPEDEGAG